MAARILIADDSPLVLKSLKGLIESHSDSWRICAEAADGREAVQKALELKPDLIILDFQMPHMDGLRASSKIAERMPRVPILINTVHESPCLKSEAKRKGVHDVILKSDSGALIRAVDALLDLDKDPQPMKSKASTA